MKSQGLIGVKIEAPGVTVTTSKKDKPKMDGTMIVKESDAQKKGDTLQEDSDNKTIIIGIVFVVLLLIGFMMIKRKKK